ncbi:MAG: hydrogenase subunit MbhD domain-containing protein [Bacilli bacterium]
MQVFEIILLVFLVVCAIAAALSRNLLTSIIIFSSYSVVMSVIWVLLQAPDLAITEAAVGAGVTSVLFFLTLKKIKQIDSNLNNVENKKNENITLDESTQVEIKEGESDEK